MVRSVKLSDLEPYERRRLWAVPGAVLLALVVITFWVIAIWSGDDRWGFTGGVLLIPTVAVGLCNVDWRGW